MDLFPIGTISGGSNSGTVDGVSYSLFEPNNGATSQIVYTNLYTRYSDQTLLTRQKALPILTLKYDYSDILSREFNQIEHFVNNKTGGLTSFYTVDWSQIIVPTSIDGSYDITLSNTRLFSSTSYYKSNWVFFWNGADWKLGSVSSVTTNTSITTNVTADYGELSAADVQKSGVVIYPVYQVYFADNPIQDFNKSKFFNHEDDQDYGYMFSGSITFMSKYKV